MSGHLSSTKTARGAFVVGLSLIGVGIICNQWVLTKAFSPDGVLEVSSKVMVWGFNLTLIVMGLICMNLRRVLHSSRSLRNLSRSHPRLSDLLMGTGFSVVLISLAEGTFYVANKYKRSMPQYETFSSRPLFEEDEALGYKHVPNVQVSVQQKANGKLVYEAGYSIDAYGRRITPIEPPERRTKFLLFFGCSFTFGQGVNDHETLPFYVARLASTFKPYNYGVIGYGPQSMLAKLQSKEIAREIQERQGVLIYTFLDDHFNRAVGSMRVHNNWGRHMPFYQLDAQDRLVRAGNFTSGRPLTALFYRALGSSQIATYWNIGMQTRRTEAHIHLTTRIIEEARNVFRHTFTSDRFYVLLYPGSKDAQRMIPAFEHAGINYLDYTELFDPSQPDLRIAGDPHPTPQAYRMVATQLTQDLGIVDLQGDR